MMERIKNIALEALHYAVIAAIVLALLHFTTGCQSIQEGPQGEQYSAREYRVDNPYTSPVIQDLGDRLEVIKPPALEFTGVTATGQQIRQWARANGINATGVFADSRYAQLESDSAIQLALWLKRALHDLGYTYYGDARDCDNFARIFRAFPDFFATDNGAQALVFGIYARMDQPFAGVTDGYHALNAAWTDRGVPVFEPQGWRELVYQDIRAWPNRSGITDINTD